MKINKFLFLVFLTIIYSCYICFNALYTLDHVRFLIQNKKTFLILYKIIILIWVSNYSKFYGTCTSEYDLYARGLFLLLHHINPKWSVRKLISILPYYEESNSILVHFRSDHLEREILKFYHLKEILFLYCLFYCFSVNHSLCKHFLWFKTIHILSLWSNVDFFFISGKF